MCSELQPEKVMDMLSRLYSGFDRLVQRHGLFKVETVSAWGSRELLVGW